MEGNAVTVQALNNPPVVPRTFQTFQHLETRHTGSQVIVTFVHEDPSHANSKIPVPRRPEQKEATRDLRSYGGACLCCRKRKRRCEPATPCNECTKSKSLCLRTRDLYLFRRLAIPQGNDTEFQLRDDVAQKTLPFLRPKWFNFPTFRDETLHMEWKTHYEEYSSLWIGKIGELDSDEINSKVKQGLVKIALGPFLSTQIEKAPRSETLASKPICKDAYEIFKLIAAIKTILHSELITQQVHVDSARYFVYLFLTICAMKLSEKSSSFASRLYGAIQSGSCDEHDIRWAVEVYRDIIERLTLFLHPESESLVSDLFKQILPRVIGIQKGLGQILPYPPLAAQEIDVPSIPDLPSCRIVIQISPETTLHGPHHATPDKIYQESLYEVKKLLGRHFGLGTSDLGMRLSGHDGTTRNSGPSIGRETVDPRKLFVSPITTQGSVSESGSGSFYMDQDSALFSNGPDGSEATEMTSLNLQGNNPSTDMELLEYNHNNDFFEEFATDYMWYDLRGVGDHFNDP